MARVPSRGTQSAPESNSELKPKNLRPGAVSELAHTLLALCQERAAGMSPEDLDSGRFDTRDTLRRASSE